jgi:hypothetical protein
MLGDARFASMIVTQTTPAPRADLGQFRDARCPRPASGGGAMTTGAREKDATIRALLRGRAGPFDATPSEIDRLLVEAALLRGMTQDDELSSLLHWRLAISERSHKLARGKHVRRTIDAARAAMFIRLRKAIDPLRDLAQL